ncbi:ABC transporter substrate-binding protein [Martelella soudanensis]|uniref:ABC transporter substrate-binding protein n=1 Tax=unclassified Martelella TaxID=2629616 RepID=UPI0015DDD43A|nr:MULTISPECIES: extracellular solute-binding protein [unclassified Martelella]
MTTLKGMTWTHPRGFEPLAASAGKWQEKTGIEVKWEKPGLEDLENLTPADIAREYDLIVIDHPHLGQITAENCLVPLDIEGREDEREKLEKGSIGGAFEAFRYKGHQWAFPIDVDAQVMAYRPDRAPGLPGNWDELVALAEDGHVMLPLRPPHNLLTFFTLAANAGTPCRNDAPGKLIAEDDGIAAYERLAELARLVPEDNQAMDPVAVLEALAAPDTRASISPYVAGYAHYARDGFRHHRLGFADIPGLSERGPAGSVLGGTGIAVSAFSENTGAAIDYAYWIASGPVQATLYAEAGGQPGHADGWNSAEVNSAVNGFYRNTADTVAHAYRRPRHNGYIRFQQQASDVLNEALRTDAPAIAVIGRLNKLFEDSF